MHHAEDPLPAGKTGQACGEFAVVSESIIRCLLDIGGGGTPDREIDDQRARDDCAAGNKAPVPGILAVIAVIAEHEIHAGRDDQFAS